MEFTRVPAPGFYAHVGELRFIDGDGKIHDHVIETERRTDRPRDELYGTDSNEQKKSSFSGFIPESFRDHVPLFYSIRFWNNIVENKEKEKN